MESDKEQANEDLAQMEADLEAAYTESCCILCEQSHAVSRYIIRDARAGIPHRVKRVHEVAERLMELINA